MPDDVAMADLLNKIQQQDLKSIAGKLNWISTHSRPDIAYDVCQTSNSTKEATVKDLVNANKALRKMKSEEVELIFPNLGDVNKVEFLCFADTSLGNLTGNASQIVYITFLLGENKRYAPIAWQSKKIPPVVNSTLAAETLALQEGCYALKPFLSELVGQHELPISIYTDNKSLAESLLSTNILRDKHLDMDMTGLCEMLGREEIKRIQWIPTKLQLADCLTKKGVSSKKLLQALKSQGTLV